MRFSFSLAIFFMASLAFLFFASTAVDAVDPDERWSQEPVPAKNGCMCHENLASPTGLSLNLKNSKYNKARIRVVNPDTNQKWTCRSGGSDYWDGRNQTEVSHTDANSCHGLSFRLCALIVRFAPGESCSDQSSQYFSAAATDSFTLPCPGTLYYGVWDSDSVCHTNSGAIRVATEVYLKK